MQIKHMYVGCTFVMILAILAYYVEDTYLRVLLTIAAVLLYLFILYLRAITVFGELGQKYANSIAENCANIIFNIKLIRDHMLTIQKNNNSIEELNKKTEDKTNGDANANSNANNDVIAKKNYFMRENERLSEECGALKAKNSTLVEQNREISQRVNFTDNTNSKISGNIVQILDLVVTKTYSDRECELKAYNDILLSLTEDFKQTDKNKTGQLLKAW